ncbi:MAG: hypothetical protein OMM_06118 [Candidatus Magnetoglobus multicellularis str. Araruama]|uniref:Uncharacterized protein n=1 Tax=Candidatus Magnetoglobus multicellularis str. Araruama TaxID=890399 RepID=A0A1V1NRF4_9BACT|nr:MAG: hypothetical protein OMM_06118 [Candidatus Magnetoglobus multicellularis str. Araruama]
MGSPCFRASERRFKTIIPQPSPRPYPLAEASNVLHLPSFDNAFMLQRAVKAYGESIRLTPPAKAISDSPFRRLSQARWTLTRDDEQAVSTDKEGPCKPKNERFYQMPYLKQNLWQDIMVQKQNEQLLNEEFILCTKKPIKSLNIPCPLKVLFSCQRQTIGTCCFGHIHHFDRFVQNN